MKLARCVITLVAVGIGCGGSNQTAQPAQGVNGQVGYNGPPQQGYPPSYQGGPQGQPGYPASNPQQQPAAAPQTQPQTGPTPQQPQAQQIPPQSQSPATPSSGTQTAASPIPGIPLDPNLIGQISAAGLAILTPGGVAGDPIEGGIKTAAARFAPNMQPEGQMAKDSLPENGHKEMVISLAAGKCYTIVGFSPAGQIRNLDLHLLMPPFYNVQAGQDDTVDNTPVIGKGASPTCPMTPFPLQYKLDIHARQGTGQFGVQVFSRSK